MSLKPLDEKQMCKTFFNCDFPKWANMMNQNEKIVCSPGMSQCTVKLNAFMCWWFCFTALGSSYFLLFVSHYIHYLPTAVPRAGSPGSMFTELFSRVARCCPQTTLIRVRPSLFLHLLPARLHWGLFMIFFFLFKQTQHKLYINKQITNFMFPVHCQVCSGPLLLNCQHSALHSPNWAASRVTFLASLGDLQTHAVWRKKKKKKKATTVVSKPSNWTWCRLRQEIKVRKGGKA